MAFRFATAGTTKLDIGSDDWIEVRNELSVAEQRELQDKSFEATQEITPGNEDKTQKIAINWAKYSLHRSMAYITRWNAADAENVPVPVSMDTLGALDEDTMQRIETALTDFLEKQPKNEKRKSGRKGRKPTSA